jgi:hypothetical protein
MKGQPFIVWGLLLGSWALVRAEFLLDSIDAGNQTLPQAVAKGEAKDRMEIASKPTFEAHPGVGPSAGPEARTAQTFAQSAVKPMISDNWKLPNIETGTFAKTVLMPPEPETIIQPPAAVPSAQEMQPVRPKSRLTGDLWLFSRSTSGPIIGTLLGGSQGGGRLKYRLSSNPTRPSLSASLRFAKPLQGQGLEISPGLSVGVGQKWPIELIVERRVRPEKGNEDQWALLAAAGIPTTELAKGLTLEGYAQAGIVGVKKPISFAQVGIGLHRSIASENNLQIKAGAGLWADQQKTTGRLDLGPEIVAVMKAGERPLRLSAQWRFKVAGDAQPGSGPSLSIATSF